MRRALFLLLALVIVTLVGCGSKSNDPIQVVKDYNQAVQKSDSNAAWTLIHLDRQNLANKKAFDEVVKKHQDPFPIKEVSLQPEISPWRDMLTQMNLPGGHTYRKAAVVKLTRSNGTTQLVHLVQDPLGNWRLIWSPEFALE